MLEAGGATVIRMCGTLVVEVAGRRVERALPSRQGRLVFAYLVLNRARPVSRDELIDALWPGRAPESPDVLLTGLLSRLRRVLPAGVLEGRSQLSLRLAPDAWIDIEVASRAPVRGQQALAGGDAGEALAVAREALEILDRPLLPDLDRHWVDERRRELNELAPVLLELVSRAGLAAGELGAAQAAAARLMDREPLRESAYALLMEVHAARGDVAQALQVYERLRTRLRDELGMIPGPAIRALGDRLLHAGRLPGERLPSPGPLRGERVLVGRQDDLAAIRRAFSDAHARMVLVTGEAGIGKTSLVVQAARAADAMTVLYGRCDEEPLAPYQPFVEALRDLLARSPGLVEDAGIAPHLAALARILPELGEAAATEDRHRLFEAVAALLEAVGDPLLFVLDDLHWADAPTRLMLRYALRRLPSQLVVLATTRDAVDSGGTVASLVIDLRREDALVRLRLAGLDPVATGELIALRARAVPHPELVRRMHARTAGNPFFIEQLMRAGSDAQVPEGVEELIAQRVAKLAPAAAETLRVAAAVGGEFELGLLERLAGDREQVVTALDAALAAGLVVESGGIPGRFAFVHLLARDAIYYGMSATRRANVHLRIADALDVASGTAYPELAHHLVEAGPLAPAGRVRDALVAAAESAATALAFETAAGYLRRALELPEHPGPRAEFELLLALAAAEQRAGDRDPARETLRRAIALARGLHDADALGRAALSYGAGFDWYGFSYHTDPALTALLEEALAAAGEGDGGLRVRLLARLALEHYHAARYEDAVALNADAVARADRLGDPQTGLLARYGALFPLDGPDDVPELEQGASRIIADPDTGVELAFRARIFRLRARLQQGDVSGVDADVEACQRAAEELRQPLYHWQAGVLRAMRALMRGAIDEGEREAQAAFATGIEAGQTEEAQYVLMPQLLTVASLRGELLNLEAPLRSYVESMPIMAPRIEAMLSWILAEGGRLDEAGKWLSRSMERGPEHQPRHSVWLPMIAMLAEASAILRAPAHAGRLLPLLSPYADRCLVTGAGAAYAGSVAYYLGRLATVLRRWEHGDCWFELALGVEHRMGAVPGVARTQLGWAALLTERDGPSDRARASELTGAALATAREFGLSGLAARADTAGLTTSRPVQGRAYPAL